MLRVAVLVSGGGTNLQAILDKMEAGYLPNASIVTVVASKPEAYALERAKKHGIPTKVIPRKEFADNQTFSQAILEYLQSQQVDLIVLAGFMYILSSEFIRAFENRMLNVHPALIPSFCGPGFYGLIPHAKALEYGVKVVGATVHFVTEECDGGPIILQKAVAVQEGDTPEILQKRVMEQAEWEILPEAIKLISEGKVHVEGRVVHIDP